MTRFRMTCPTCHAWVGLVTVGTFNVLIDPIPIETLAGPVMKIHQCEEHAWEEEQIAGQVADDDA